MSNGVADYTFVVFGDLHSRGAVEVERVRRAARAAVAAVPAPTAIIVTGDLAEARRTPAVDYKLAGLAGLWDIQRLFPRGTPLLFVPGNHDLKDVWKDTVGNLDGTFTTVGGFVAAGVVIVGGLVIAGVGGATGHFGFPYEPEDTDMRRALAKLPEKVDVLLTHQPPARTAASACSRGGDGGSFPIRAFVQDHQPRVHVCGHIHEAFGVERLDTTVVVNAGAFGAPYEACRYAVVEVHRHGPLTDAAARIVEVP